MNTVQKLKLSDTYGVTYVVGEVSSYDEENQLWETKVGLQEGDKPLHYSVWGKTENLSQKRAANLVKLLNGLKANP